jgi:Peptidase family M28
MSRSGLRAVAVVAAIVMASCSSSTSSPVTTVATSTTTALATTTTVAPAATAPTTAATTTTVSARPKVMTAKEIVEALASDELKGRNNDTPESAAARKILIDQLATFAKPAYPAKTGDDRYLQTFENGTNVFAVIPGGDLADQYVVISAHYDHLGYSKETGCQLNGGADIICNGATDNAAGAASAVTVARNIAAAGTPRRSVLIALLDREEDGLLGSVAYVKDPVVPLAKTVANVNFDIQGSNLLPSLASTTVAVGAETGGPNLVTATANATKASKLNTVMLSLLFGQGRSDHATFAASKIPTVFFTDANSGCYHHVTDDVKHTDFAKLDQQLLTATALMRDLVATDTPPVFTAAPSSSYADAVSMLKLMKNGEADLGLLTAEDQPKLRQYIVDLTTIVDAGPGAFNDDSVGKLLGGAIVIVRALSNAPCPAINV